jgi:hypothetical protein
MSRNLIHLTLFALLLGLCLSGPALAADPNLVGWWKLDGNAEDSSGNGRHGTPMGGVQFGPGVVNEALVNMDGSDDYVNIDGYKGILGTQPWSAGAWIMASGTANHRACIGWGNNANMQRIEIRLMQNTNILRANHGSGNVNTQNALDAGEWYHFVLTVVEGATCSYPDMIFYINGVDDTAPQTDPDVLDIVENADLGIGRRASHSDRYFAGSIDEVVLYDKVLTPEEVLSVFAGNILSATGLALGENPENEAVDVLRDVTLSWSPGQFAVAHNVYLGTVFEDVNSASLADPLGALVSEGQDANSLYAGILEFGQTYYWRVDEVNGAPDRTVFKGETWSFEIEPFSLPITAITATASSSHNEAMGPEKTVDASGLDDQDLHSNEPTHMWLSGMGDPTPTIQFDFDKSYKLHELWVWNSNQAVEGFVGLGAKDVIIETSMDGDAWTQVENMPPFAQAPGKDGYAHNTVVDLGGVTAQYVKLTVTAGYGMIPQYGLSEARFFSIPTQAREPQPENDAADVVVDTILTWRPGREAASHQVTLGTDPDAVAQGTGAVDTTDASYDPGTLDLASTYYWQVVEVNEAETPPAHASDIWSFSTQEFIVVDDFEGYNDNCDRIFFAWEDGLGHSGSEGIEGCNVTPSNGNGGGSIVGHAQSPFAEQGMVHGGGQSMPLAYDNAFGLSETSLTLSPAQDWTGNGIKGLVLWFAGDAENTGSDLYVKINNTTVSYDGPADSLSVGNWQKWYIDLQGLGGNLSNVSSLTIGIGSGAGMIYVDDIVLTPQERALVTPVDPDPANLLAHFAFDGDASDSVGGLQGTLVENATYGPGQQGQALSLNTVTVTDYMEITGYKGIEGSSAFTIALWLNTAETLQQQIMYFGTDASGQRCEFRVHDNGRIRMGNGGGQVEGFTDITDGNWHHVVVSVKENATNSSSDVRIYIDGRDDTQESEDLDPPYDFVPDGDVTIGYRPSASDRFLIGQIDELSIYNRALSAAEVAGMAGVTQPFDK